MISPVHEYIENYANAGADIITIHPEATENLKESISLIKKFSKKVGVSLNPKTEIKKQDRKDLSNKMHLVND